jgi:hydrogenase maturation protease
MTARARTGVLVAGIGNSDRGDDGFGPAVARRLRGETLPGVRIVERRGDILALIADWDGFAAVVLVDAAASTTELGRLHRFDLDERPLPIGSAYRSTHGFGVAEAVELARSLGRLPPRVVLYLAEGTDFSPGAPLSPAVAKAVDEAAARIAAELAVIAANLQAEGGAASYA